ncbi:MAG TPA: phytanoyl-CoA dioxygenase family protein [Flavobacteriales bacterium]
MARTLPSSSALGEQLTPEQRASFAQFGAIHFPGFISKDAVAQLWKAVEEAQARLVAENVEKVNGTPLKYGTDTDGRRIIQRMAFANQQHPVLAEFLRDPRFKVLLDLIPGNARLGIDEKDGLVVNHYVNTDASKFTQMGWHTDSLRDVFLGKRILPMLNVGIHLDDQDPRNGGLRLLPGTHEQNLFNLLFRKRYFLNNDPDRNEVAFEIKAGDLTVHDGRLWHRVERSSLVGEASRRRVMYIPIISGKYSPKSPDSATPFYHRFQHLVK